MRFSLIIPSYNNAKELTAELPKLLLWLESKDYAMEVIVVDDGSNQSEMLRGFCTANNLRLIQHDVNLGKGAAVRTGMLAANEDIRIFTDADIPFQYSVFPAILEEFKIPEVMVVAGDRRRSDYFSKTPWIRRMGSAVFSWMVNIIMMRNLGDTQCGIKAFRAASAEEIFPKAKINGFAADIEWLYLATRAGWKIHGVNAEFRNAGESSVVFWKQAVKMLVDVLRLRFRL